MATNASVERTLGIILGKLEGMDERMEKAEASRAGVHRRLDDLLQRTTHLEGEVAATKDKVEGMEKVTVEVTTLRTKAQGAGTLGRWLIRAGIGIVTLAGWLLGVYTWLTGRPPQ
ncbi:MAG: hypothetical protein ABS35_37710 [Kaistia sp. SCN 65-12]|nr:MAG: hypothetical protein ABS35_37710 [Kaistia sp. SCN 65-12]